MRNVLTLLCLLLISANTLAEIKTLRGQIFKKDDSVFFKSNDGIREIQLSEKFKYTLDEVMVNSPLYTFEIEGEVSESKIVTSKVPTVFGGVSDLRGHLHIDNNGELRIDDQLVKFGRTKEIYKNSFDSLSKNSYLDKFVTTQGYYKDGTFFIDAILEDQLISAKSDHSFNVPKGFNNDPKDFIIDEMAKNKYSQLKNSFRGTLFQKKNYEVEVGESVLIITLSGRQGDAPGAAGGHFTVGMGEVMEDMTIKGEVSNFYFTGPKEVLAGNTDLVSYFGHLIQGQINYRPTYTLYAFGVDKNKLRKVRDELERENHKVRTVPGLQITPGYNCATTSTSALNEVGIHGNHRNFFNSIFDVQNLSYVNPFSYGASKTDGKGTIGTIRTVSYALSEDPENYVPRAAFNSFVENFASKKKNKKMGIKKVDYIFIPQVPSSRQVGGMSYDDPIKEGKKVIDFNKARNKRIANEEKARAILENTDSSEDQIQWAREISKNEISREEDQKMVREFFDKTID